jgi:hypothetical protein
MDLMYVVVIDVHVHKLLNQMMLNLDENILDYIHVLKKIMPYHEYQDYLLKNLLNNLDKKEKEINLTAIFKT